MVSWFWLGMSVLAIPPIAFGLVFASLYLYIRLKRREDIRLLLKVLNGATWKVLPSRGFLGIHWSLFLPSNEMDAGIRGDNRHNTHPLDRNLLIGVGALFFALVCIAAVLLMGL